MERRRDRIKAREDDDRLHHLLEAKMSERAAKAAQGVLEGIDPPTLPADRSALRRIFDEQDRSTSNLLDS